MTMGTRYEIEPVRVGRATDRRRPALVVAVILVVVAAVLLKPWDVSTSVAPQASVVAVRPTDAPVDAVAPPVPRVLRPPPTDPSRGGPAGRLTTPDLRVAGNASTRHECYGG